MSKDITIKASDLPDVYRGQCTAALNIAGEHYQCDYGKDHTGLAHGSIAASAIWVGADDA